MRMLQERGYKIQRNHSNESTPPSSKKMQHVQSDAGTKGHRGNSLSLFGFSTNNWFKSVSQLAFNREEPKQTDSNVNESFQELMANGANGKHSIRDFEDERR